MAFVLKKSVFNLFACGILAWCLFSASVATSQMARDDVIGEVISYAFRADDTVAKVARRFDVGFQALLDANPGKKSFKKGDLVTLPTAHILPSVRHEGVVINLAELRLYLFSPDAPPQSFPISIGKEGWETPLGETVIARKRENPVWIPTPALRKEDPSLPLSVPPGPANPLGAYALNLGWPGFAIHGTNVPDTIGRRVSHGCIRMYPEDIKVLFEAVATGTKVTVIDAAYKLGWRNNLLFLEISSPRRNARNERRILPPITEIHEAVRREAGAANIVWDAVATAAKQRDGVPVPVATAGHAPPPAIAGGI